MNLCTLPVKGGFAGEVNYLKAEELFREAFIAQPSYERAYRQFAVLLVEKYRWRELAATARERLDVTPWDSWAGSARYTVTMVLQRDHSTLGRIGVQITGAFARSVGVQRGEDRVTMQFERTVAHAPMLVDNVALSLGDTPPGAYRLTLIVADRGSGRTTTRSIPLVIRP